MISFTHVVSGSKVFLEIRIIFEISSGIWIKSRLRGTNITAIMTLLHVMKQRWRVKETCATEFTAWMALEPIFPPTNPAMDLKLGIGEKLVFVYKYLEVVIVKRRERR